MTPTEAVILCRAAAAMCPAQHFDEYTPDAWFDVLDDIDLDSAKQALKALGRRKPFIAPSEIRAEVKRIRAERLAAADLSLIQPPPEVRDGNELAYRMWLRETREAIARGDLEIPASGSSVASLPRTGGPTSIVGALPKQLTNPTHEENRHG